MSDALLKEISGKLSDIHAALTKGSAAQSGGATAATKTNPPAGGTAGKTSTTPGTANKAAPGTANKAAPGTNKSAASAPAANAKAPGGKYTSDQVRDIVKQVATNANLGKQEALTILDEEGGVQNVSSLKPENFDKVYEACQVALQGVAGHDAGGGEDPDDPTA